MHTPGPWKLVIDDSDTTYEDGTPRVPWYWVWNDNKTEVIVHSSKQRDTSEPNIRLIAAAPELLEACKELLSVFSLYDALEKHGNDNPMIGVEVNAYHAQDRAQEMARAAIARAEGRS